jgi:chemotaxis protein methyltransferase CheR
VWKALKSIVTQVIDENSAPSKPIVMWSAGCARGEEAYSLALLAKEINDRNIPLIIYASDIDRESLEEAKKGIYEASKIERALKNAIKDGIISDIEKYFICKDDFYYLRDEVKSLVEFRSLDLTASEYILDVDILLCRNVFIYFTKGLQEQIVKNFYLSLNNQGYLIVGNVEILSPKAKSIFTEIDNTNRIYQKVSS